MAEHPRGVPLRWRLPLSIAVVLLAVVTAVGWIGWRSTRLGLFDAAVDRLNGATTVLTQLLGQTGESLSSSIAELATDPDVIAAARAGRPTPAARRILASHDTTSSGIDHSEIRAPGGRLILASREVPDEDEVGWVTAGQGISPFIMKDSIIYYGAAAPLLDDRDTVGWAVEWRRTTSTATGIQRIQGLIGPGTQFLVGVPGGVWTSLLDSEPGSRPEDLDAGITREIVIPGLGSFVGQGRPVPGTPWWVWVGLGSRAVYARAQQGMAAVAIIAGVLVLAGALAGWLVSRSITRPLIRLASAADGIASGDFDRRAPAGGDAELRHLADSFNRMADEVQAGTRLLEERVARRTRELHDAQDALVRRERLAILGQLASSVGHELRNPLGVLTNAVFFLEATLKDLPPKAAEYLTILRTQVNLAEKIVSDLLDFARVKTPLRERVPLHEIVNTQIDRLSLPSGVTIIRDYPDQPMSVSVDPTQLGQVVLNLATNAVQAVEQTGDVTFAISANGAEVALRVRDTGPGIDAASRDKVFEPLFTTKARGIGLGLAVSRALAEANEGRLALEDTGPRGTTFLLELPASDREST